MSAVFEEGRDAPYCPVSCMRACSEHKRPNKYNGAAVAAMCAVRTVREETLRFWTVL